MARKDITMTEEEVHDFLSGEHILQVASIGADGFPHLAPMWYVLEDDRIVFRSFTRSQKIVNLTRNPKLSVLVEAGHGYDELRGVMIRGEARLVTDPEYVLELYGKLASRYPMFGGEREDVTGDALEAAFGRFAPKNTAVVVEPVKMTSWDHRKLGGAY